MPQPLDPAIAPAPVAETAPDTTAEQWRAKIRASQRWTDARLAKWKNSVQSRIGKAFAAAPTTDTVNVPADWSRTKNKQAQLFFQVPRVQLRPLHPQFTDTAPVAGAALNWKLAHEVKAYKAMDEILADVINAAGEGISMIGYEEVSTDVQVPTIDTRALGLTPEQVQQGIEQGLIPTQTVPQKLFCRYYMQRIAPQNFLYPIEFTGSDFQEAPWLGWQGWMPLEKAKREFKLPPDYEVENACDTPEYLTGDKEERKSDDKYVHFTEIFYRANVYRADDPHPHKLRRMVLLDNKESEAVIDEDFKWQRYDPQTRRYLGLRTFPLKVCTLTYVSDMPVPPSDSEMGRPQVEEMIEHRSMMVQQRKSSQPMRWFDVNQVDEDIVELLKKGDYQGMIPMNGPGSTAIGEVARAQYPRESYDFMRIIKQDLDDAWSSGDNQNGHTSEGDTSATEANIVQSNANLRGDYERAKVLRFFQENAEGIFALMQLFQDDEEYAEIVGQDGLKTLQAWDRTKIPGEYIFEIAPDAAQRVDVGQRRADLLKLYNLARQDPMMNPMPLLRELVSLYGLDGTQIIHQPAPQPDRPNVGYSFKGEDLTNPMAVAMLQKSGINITPDDIAAAKRLIVDAAGETVVPVPGAEAGAAGATLLDGGQPPMLPLPEHGGTPPVQEPITKRYEGGASAL